MFRMDDLKDLAAERFKNQLRELWMSDTFPDCIQEVYVNSAPSDFSMKCIVVEVSRAHLKQLTKRQNVQGALRQVGDFAVDLFRAVGDDDFM